MFPINPGPVRQFNELGLIRRFYCTVNEFVENLDVDILCTTDTWLLLLKTLFLSEVTPADI